MLTHTLTRLRNVQLLYLNMEVWAFVHDNTTPSLLRDVYRARVTHCKYCTQDSLRQNIIDAALNDKDSYALESDLGKVEI